MEFNAVEHGDAEGGRPGSLPPGQAASRQSIVRAMWSEKWLSLFKKGVEFLAELSCVFADRNKRSCAANVLSGNRPQALRYISWTGRSKKPCGRALVIKQAKAAFNRKLYGRVHRGHGVPIFSSKASKNIS